MEVGIRRAQQSDITEILSLFVDTIRHTCKDDYQEEQIQVWTSSAQNREKWLTRINTQYFILAEINGSLVGFASLENGNYLDVLYVHKDHLRQGIAHQLYENIKKKSLESGSTQLTAHVSKTARPFFEAKGFAVHQENITTINGVEIMNYQMIEKQNDQHEH